MRASRPAAAALVALTLLAVSCGSGKEPRVTDSGGVLRVENVARTDPGAVDLGPLVSGMTQFAHDLYAAVADPAANTVVSPLSIALAASMVRAGAGGATAAEIDRALHFPAGDRDAAFNALTRALVTSDRVPAPTPSATRTPGQTFPPVVSVANAVFVQDGQPVGAEFLRTLAADYGAGLRTVDFASGGAEATINEWVRRQTADRIKKLFDSLDPATKLVIANAVYLKADWQVPFVPDLTKPEPFTRTDGSEVQARMMHTEYTDGYAAGDGWQAVQLAYAKSRLAMWVLVPTGRTNPGDLLTPATLTAVARGLTPTPVDLALPKWDFATDVDDLTKVLQRLGMRTAFTPAADFSAIAPGLFISQAVHRANITVDEFGTEAAAVTGFGFATSARQPPPVTVRADHPFAFVVVDRDTHAPLFVGSVADPTAR